MLVYKAMKKLVFAEGTIPDGYNGKRIKVGFAFYCKQTIAVAPFGYFTTGLPDAFDEKEAFELLKNHPRSRAKKVKLICI